MYELWLISHGKPDEFRCRAATANECRKFMLEDLQLRGITPYYYRTWEEDDGEMVDFGSHFIFYKIRKVEINND